MATTEDVERLAKLSRLEVPADTLAEFAAEFDTIISYIGQLDQLQVKIEPVLPAHHNIFREDGGATIVGEWTEALAAQFPQRDGNSLSVKKIISHE
jgi:aspartyl-tRNA(Asn)/glutamyl-tRNA(Gln) amidotransferase subunit C